MDKSKFTIEGIKQRYDKLMSKSLEKIQIVNQYIRSKQKIIMISTITGFVIIVSSFGLYYFNSDTIYHVVVDGQEIGIVNDKAIIEVWEKENYDEVKDEYLNVEVSLKNDIVLVSERKLKTDYDNSKVLETLKSIVTYEAVGVAIVVDGKSIGVVNNLETASSLLSMIEDNYKPKKESTVSASSIEAPNSDEIQLLNIEILEEVTFQNVGISPEEIILEEDMLTLLKKGTLEEKVYIVQKGDTISGIAQKFDLTKDQLYKMNPELKGELIHIGDELIVTAYASPVTVRTVENKKRMEEIAYPIKYETDNSMFYNEAKVLVMGVEGKKLVEYKITKENGNVIEKIILSEEIQQEPIGKVVLKGTKIVPTKGSGTMSWPTVGGIITSNYGPRWGSFHYGIDISGVSDRTIKAADNGTVSFTGYRGGYGNCVIIDHGNGTQTLYGHLNSISVSVGSSIAKGQKIGVMGCTGNSYGVHLHFEVIVNGDKKNPVNYVGN